MMEVSSKELRQRAWERLRGNYGRSLGVSVVGALLASLGFIFTNGPMSAGVANYYIKQQREEEVEFEEVFSGFGRYGSAFCLPLLQWLYIFLWSLIPVVGLIFGSIIKPFAYSQSYYFMMDYGMGANDAITKSKEMMQGYKWKLFCLNFSFIGWYLLCILTLGIGFIFLSPYVEAANAEFYAELLEVNGEGDEYQSYDASEASDPFADSDE